MCNRIATPSTEKISAAYPELEVLQTEASYHCNGYDHGSVPVLISAAPALIQPARWGYLPEDARTPDDLSGYDTLNARSETIFESRLYGEAARARRCILFVDGFFEFKHYQGKKFPHFIAKEHGETFTFGGLWSNWKGVITCTIITTPANSLMAEIHNVKRRMPLILHQDTWAQWLDTAQPQDVIQHMMQPYAAEDLMAWQVGSRLTQKGADKNVPEVQEPAGPKFATAPYPEPVALPGPDTPRKKRSRQRPPSPQLGLF